MPGAVSLAHQGLLLLDERPEFKRHVLEVWREPLEKSVIYIQSLGRPRPRRASFARCIGRGGNVRIDCHGFVRALPSIADDFCLTGRHARNTDEPSCTWVRRTPWVCPSPRLIRPRAPTCGRDRPCAARAVALRIRRASSSVTTVALPCRFVAHSAGLRISHGPGSAENVGHPLPHYLMDRPPHPWPQVRKRLLATLLPTWPSGSSTRRALWKASANR
jgi:Magnesium chelatase, subunit ChlI